MDHAFPNSQTPCCLLLLLVLRRSLQIPIPTWAMKATVFSSSGRGPYSFVCMSTLSLQMDCLTLLYSLQSCSTCWAVSAACPHEQRSFSYSAMLHHNDHITNAEVGNKITKAVGPHEDPLTTVKKRKLKCYGHITRFQRWINIR